MLLTDFEVSNFRGIRHAQISGLKRVNFFAGRNNCGKTTLLEAVFLLTGISSIRVLVDIVKRHRIDFESVNSLVTYFYQQDPRNKLEMRGKREGGEGREMSLLPTFASNDTIVSSPKASAQTAMSPIQNTEPEIVQINQRFSIQTQGSSPYISEAIVQTTPVNERKTPDEVARVRRDTKYKETWRGFYVPADARFAPGPDFARLIEEKQDSWILDVLRQIDPRIHRIVMLKDVLMMDIGAPKLLPMQLIGDGCNRIIDLLVGLWLCAHGGALFIDEIENGLHYSAMQPFLKVLIAKARELDVQLFITTHNLELLRMLSEYYDEQPEGGADDLAYFNVIRRENDEVVFSRYTKQQLSATLDMGLEVRE